jgi:hypothetical protein
LKDPSTTRSIPIQVVGLSLYESLPGTTAEQCGSEVIRTQWLYGVSLYQLIQMTMINVSNRDSSKVLLGRRVLIIVGLDVIV